MKFSILTLVTPFILSVNGYRIFVPQGIPTVGKPMTIKWTKEANDPPTFTIELQNPKFNNDLALASNVDGSFNEFTVPALQSVPEGGEYIIRFVKEDNINIQFGESPTFFIAAESTDTSTVPSTKPATATRSTTAIPSRNATSTSGFGVTASNSNTVSIPTGSASVSGSSAGPSASAPGQPLNNGALGLGGLGVGGGILGVVAGLVGLVML